MNYWLVIAAAGTGRRFGAAKQHAPLAGATVLQWALRPFMDDARCRGAAIVLAPTDHERAVLRARLPERFRLVDGGTERVHSVLLGLAALSQEAQAQDWVLVHDAARPCLSAGDLDRLLTQGVTAEGGLLATRVADTVKQAPPDLHCVTATLPRETLWLAQTPQMFRHGALTAALTAALAAGRLPTDEAQAMEWQGAQPLLVQARDANPKVTTAVDLRLAEVLLREGERP